MDIRIFNNQIPEIREHLYSSCVGKAENEKFGRRYKDVGLQNRRAHQAPRGHQPRA